MVQQSCLNSFETVASINHERAAKPSYLSVGIPCERRKYPRLRDALQTGARNAVIEALLNGLPGFSTSRSPREGSRAAAGEDKIAQSVKLHEFSYLFRGVATAFQSRARVVTAARPSLRGLAGANRRKRPWPS